jgi:uroporphyrinogen III methyltransferase/synthase
VARVKRKPGTARKKPPLSGRRIVITRPRAQAGEFVRLIEELGGEVVEFPTIRIVPPASYAPLDRAIRRIKTYQWIIFTSVNGVKHFWKRFTRLNKRASDLSGARIAAIGPRTAAELRSLGLSVALLPPQYRAEAIAEKLGKAGVKGKNVLLPRAAKARDVLPLTLQEWGATVDVVEAYRTGAAHGNPARLKTLLRQKKIDVVTFTSSSTVNHFAELFAEQDAPNLLRDCVVACIGPITRETAERLGIRVDVVAGEFTIPGLTRVIAEHFGSKE